jgi:hypothetical protein
LAHGLSGRKPIKPIACGEEKTEFQSRPSAGGGLFSHDLPELKELDSIVASKLDRIDRIVWMVGSWVLRTKAHESPAARKNRVMKTIGNHLGTSESAVSEAGNRPRELFDLDRELKKRVQTIEKKLRIASFKT